MRSGRGTPHTLEILQELGFIYYIDDVSRDEPLAFVLIDVMNGSDVRMIEGRCGSGFSLEALQRVLILGQVFGQELERCQAEQLRVFGLVDHARAAVIRNNKTTMFSNRFFFHRTGRDLPQYSDFL